MPPPRVPAVFYNSRRGNEKGWGIHEGKLGSRVLAWEGRSAQMEIIRCFEYQTRCVFELLRVAGEDRNETNVHEGNSESRNKKRKQTSPERIA